MANRYGGRILSAVAYDGDTIKCRVDLGFHVSLDLRVRLDGIDTPEIRTRDALHKKAGFKARSLAQQWLDQAAKPLWFVSTAKPKYAGRAIGRLTDAAGASLTDSLLDLGAGKPYQGGMRYWTELELSKILELD